jgi:hypothetical protein
LYQIKDVKIKISSGREWDIGRFANLAIIIIPYRLSLLDLSLKRLMTNMTWIKKTAAILDIFSCIVQEFCLADAGFINFKLCQW